jgi:hypothetical protein
MNDEDIICNVCKKLYLDDHEFICHDCVEKWKQSIIAKAKADVLNDVEQIIREDITSFSSSRQFYKILDKIKSLSSQSQKENPKNE